MSNLNSSDFFSKDFFNEIFYGNSSKDDVLKKSNKILVKREQRDSEYALFVPAPGNSKETVEVSVALNVLKVSFNSFYNSEQVIYETILENDVDKDKIRAKVDNGVVEIILPKLDVQEFKVKVK